MRNLFDQYAQPENRVTHALASALAEDRRLLQQFVRWITGDSNPLAGKLEILEQSLPGQSEVTEEESERRGLPDICIHDNNQWALLVESKISARATIDQLRRHYRVALRRGYTDIHVLVIGVVPPRRTLPEWAQFVPWADIYTWLRARDGSEWAARVATYLSVAEAKFSEDGYLREGTLTVFTGVPFNEGDPYNYPEAKRLLKLALDELRKRKELSHQLGMNPRGIGRGAITGKGGHGVWDFLRIKESKESEPFIRFPHLTLVFEHDRVLAVITIPHGIKPAFRRNVTNLGYEGFCGLLGIVNQNLSKALRKARGAAPWVTVVQRRYPTQRSEAILDASLQYDLRTAFPSKGKTGKVKIQSQWLQATYDALAHKRSNLQVAVGAIFPYRTCKVTKQPEILDYIAGTWLACKPLVNTLLGKRT